MVQKLTAVLLFLGAAALCATAAAAATPEEERKYQADLEEGIGLLQTGVREDIQRAIGRFKTALKLNPESAEVYFWLALAQSDLGLYVQAAQNASDATAYDDRMGEAWSLWGQILLYRNDWSEAKQKLRTAQTLLPEDPVIHFNLGQVYYYGEKDYSAALASFRTAWQRSQALVRTHPEFTSLAVNARMFMGLCEYERGLAGGGRDTYFNNAINAFMDVLKEQPDNYDAALRLALAYRKSGRIGESANILRNLVKVLGESPAAGQYRLLLTEINLQLADIYVKEPSEKDEVFALAHLQEFLRLAGGSNHPALDPVRQHIEEMQRTRSM